MRKGIQALAMVAAMGLLAACQSSEDRAAEHLESAMSLIADGDFERATIEFRNVFQLMPQNRDARMAYAAMLETRDALPQAYAQYAQVVDQVPGDLDALRAAARIAATIGNWPAARTQVDAALALAPDAPDMLAVKVGADYAEAVSGGDDAARAAVAAEAATLLASQPDNLLLHQVVIDSLIRAQTFSAAERAVDAAIAIAPENKDLYMTRVSVLLALQDEPAVEAQLQDLVTRFPDDPAMGATLLRWYVSRNELDKAEAYLRAAAAADNVARMDLVGFLARFRTPAEALTELDRIIAEADTPTTPSDTPTAPASETASETDGATDTGDVTLATFRALRASLQFDQGAREEAIAEMQAIIAGAAVSDETRRVKVTLARMLFTTGDAVGARALVESVLAEDATNLEAVKLKSAWLIEGDEIDEAVALLRTGLDANPRDTQIMTLLAQAYERLGNRDLMGDMLSQAVVASNSAPEESVRYASFLAAAGTFLPAETVLIDALRLDSANVTILRPLGEIYIALQDWPRASSVADRLQDIGSDEAVASSQSLRAAILQGQSRTDEAVGYLQGLVAEGNAGLSAQVAIIGTYLGNGEGDKARTLITELRAANPEDPSLRFVEGTVQSALGDSAAAEATFRALVAEDPTRLPIWIALVRHLAMTDPQAARTALDEALVALPDAGDLLLLKAGYLEQDGDIPGAIAIYTTLYDQNSSDQILANNLASLLSTHQADDPASLERAYVIARRLRGTTVPAFADTFGWITHLRGDSADALPYMEIAAAGLAQDPRVQFHLAEVYRALSRPDEAREAYARVLTLVPDTDTRPFVQSARTLATGDIQPDPPE